MKLTLKRRSLPRLGLALVNVAYRWTLMWGKRAAAPICLALLMLALNPWSSPARAQADPRVELLEAARLDQESVAIRLLLRGVDPNIREKDAGPVIVYAAREKSFGVVRALAIDPRTAIDAANAQKETALMYAALHGDLKTVKVLVDKGAGVNREGWSPLHYAASSGHVEVVKFLLENHAYIDAASPGNVTPLMMAARHNQTSASRLLVEEGADPSLKSDQGLTAADYWKRIKDPVEEAWMRKQAAEFVKKYGTKEAPVLSKPAE
jgi:uncharacterized protein